MKDDTGIILGAVLILTDITELIELDKMKDDFIKVAAHELKTPVTIMKGYAQALRKFNAGSTDQNGHMLDSIEKGANRISNIIENLLDITQLQAGKMHLRRESINLTDISQKAIEELAPNAPTHSLKIVETEQALVFGDYERLTWIIKHLLENAIKYSPQGGEVEIAVKNSGSEGMISVKDYGVGIPREKQVHIFECFFRAHTGTPHDYGGMGVGLYISNEIVRKLGGRMWFQSEEGKGSNFCLCLPLARTNEQS
jgi:signal transduction histidine kinase